MSVTIYDSITRVANAYRRGQKTTGLVNSKFTRSILDLFARAGYIASYEVINDRTINVNLRYIKSIPAIDSAKFISRPGRRMYISVKEFPIDIPGILVISTPKGVYSHKEAIKADVNQGGEVICHIK